MDKEELKIKLEELKIKPDKVDEIVSSVYVKEKEITSNIKSINDQIIDTQTELDNTPENEWRHKAKLAARIISLRCDE